MEFWETWPLPKSEITHWPARHACLGKAHCLYLCPQSNPRLVLHMPLSDAQADTGTRPSFLQLFNIQIGHLCATVHSVETSSKGDLVKHCVVLCENLTASLHSAHRPPRSKLVVPLYKLAIIRANVLRASKAAKVLFGCVVLTWHPAPSTFC